MLKGAVRRFLPYKEGHGIGGTSMDFYADMGIPFTYTVELPDFGQYGMLIPSSMISTVWANIEEIYLSCTLHIMEAYIVSLIAVLIRQ